MLTPKQQTLWLEGERKMRDGLACRLASLIRACESINPLVEQAIGGLENAGCNVVGYHVTLAEARMDLKLLADYQERFAAAMMKSKPAAAVETRTLRSGRDVPSLAESVAVTLSTHCPAKWAVVDLETGELWGHDGAQFKRLSSVEAAEVVAVAARAAK